MANVLANLFTDIADSIRSKTGNTDKMAPIDFPSEIAKIVVGSGGSDSGLGNLKINSGSFYAEDNIYVRTIEHGLGVMPDMVIVRHEYLGEQSDGCTTFIVGIHSRICNAFNISGNYYSSTNMTWATPEKTLDNVDESIKTGRLFCRDDSTFEVGSLESASNGFFSTEGRYHWMAISGMGGGVEGIPTGYKTVTFKNGDNVLFERLVLSGDDCPDPLTQGRIETPTKESTPQYNYTHSGWTSVDGGTANSSILKNITEDKVVYSAYTSTVRKYTVTYYDEDGTTVLNTEQVAYGTVPSYTPEKQDYDFDAWIPEVTAVVEDTSYKATWKEKATFGTASWSQISEIIENGTAKDYFTLGDTRQETITYTDGTTEQVTFEIVDTNSSTILSGTHMAIMATHTLQEPTVYCQSGYDKMGYYAYSALKDYLKNEILPCLPEDMQSVMKSVSMPYANAEQKLHIPTLQMLTGQGYPQTGSTSQYDWLEAFENGKSLIYKTRGGTAVQYWTATSYSYGGSGTYCTYVKENGTTYYNSNGSSDNKYIVLLFFI